MALQITAMADIFTVLLVFLLKSFATSATTLSPSQGMMLPSARAGEAAIEALKVEVSQTGVQVEGKMVVPLINFKFDPTDIQSNFSSKVLSAALDKERQRQLLIAKANSDVKVDAKILIAADQRVPYRTLKSVLASAALTGYTDFKLAVVAEE